MTTQGVGERKKEKLAYLAGEIAGKLTVVLRTCLSGKLLSQEAYPLLNVGMKQLGILAMKQGVTASGHLGGVPKRRRRNHGLRRSLTLRRKMLKMMVTPL